jgi:hypothetical protein
LLQQLICHWDHARQGFKVSPDLWYHHTKEDVYFIIGLSIRGWYLPHFSALPPGVAGETQLEYMQIYLSMGILSAFEFQVRGGHLRIGAFQRQDSRFMCHMLSLLPQYSYDG